MGDCSGSPNCCGIWSLFPESSNFWLSVRLWYINYFGVYSDDLVNRVTNIIKDILFIYRHIIVGNF